MNLGGKKKKGNKRIYISRDGKGKKKRGAPPPAKKREEEVRGKGGIQLFPLLIGKEKGKKGRGRSYRLPL